LKRGLSVVNIIAAYSRGRVIGSGGRIPWNIPEDKRRFRLLTTGHIVIMGRKSYEEIGKPLAGRANIIVSGSADFSGENLYTARSLPESLELAADIAEKRGGCEIFLCGGERIYREGLAFADRLYLTEIDAFFPGDAFFPELGERFRLDFSEEISGEYSYRNCIYVRK
jgi:dihydrofolate reductase